MQRPTTRPERPYTTAEILTAVYQHFVLDGSPRCVEEGGMACLYAKTGCAVGCLLTEEDALLFDDPFVGGAIGHVATKQPELFGAYFTEDQRPLLRALQRCHDQSEGDPIAVTMKSAVKALRVFLGL